MTAWYYYWMSFMLSIPHTEAWVTWGPEIYDNLHDRNVSLKGINWFGFETKCKIVHGLWVRDIDTFFDFFTDYQYNALRLPISVITLTEWDTSYPMSDCLNENNKWLSTLSVKQALHVMFQKAAAAGMVILLDFHTIEEGIIPMSPTQDSFSEDQFVDFWVTVLHEYAHYPNFLGIDVKNEPHGEYSWAEWSRFLPRVIARIDQLSPLLQDKLIFVEGVEEYGSVWGGSFVSMPRTTPEDHNWMRVWNDERIVYSPHIYGITVRGPSAMDDTHTLYDRWFGNLKRTYDKCIVIGEVGGWFIDQDAIWQLRFLKYLQLRGISNLFYWVVNPNSHDTGGIFYNDWYTLNTQKISYHERLQPNPTEFVFDLSITTT